jgi:hypothetical protein
MRASLNNLRKRALVLLTMLLVFIVIASPRCAAATSIFGASSGDRFYVITFDSGKAARTGTYRIYFSTRNAKNQPTTETWTYPFAVTRTYTGIKLAFRRGSQTCLPWVGSFSHKGQIVSFETIYPTGDTAYLRFGSITGAAVASNLSAMQYEASLLSASAERSFARIADVHIPRCR